MSVVVWSIATANPPKKVTQQRVYQFLRSRFELGGEQERLYEKILLDGPIQTRYFGLDRDEDILLQDQDHLIERFLKYGRLIAARMVKEIVNRLLERHSLRKEQIAFWAVHPGGSLVLEGIQKELDPPAGTLDFSYEVLRGYGNMSSPSVMFVLERILQKAKPKREQKCLLPSFGASFTAFAGLVEF
jgi:predicted naringenin-chalcone synthase